jgi:hypothetical protein
VVGAGVGDQVYDGLGRGAGDGGVDGDLMLVPVVDGFDVEDGQQFFGEGVWGAGEDVAEDGQLVQQRGVVLAGGGFFQSG